MDTLKQKLSADLKESLKNKDEVAASTLRMAIAAIGNKEIEIRKKDIGLSDEEAVAILLSEVKKRKDAVREYEKGGRADLAEKEKAEMTVLAKYLPAELPDEEVLRIVRDGVREAGAAGMSDFSKVMKVVMPILKGRADGERVSAMVRDVLGSLNG